MPLLPHFSRFSSKYALLSRSYVSNAERQVRTNYKYANEYIYIYSQLVNNLLNKSSWFTGYRPKQPDPDDS